MTRLPINKGRAVSPRPPFFEADGSPSRPYLALSAQRGFTLIEVLVALTVLAMGIALTLSLISGSLGNIRKIEKRSQIIDHANSVMELALIDRSIKGPTSFNGDFADGTRWIVRVEEYVSDNAGDAAALSLRDMPVKLLAYTVEMSQPRSHSVDYRLRTLKLVPTEEF